MFIFNFEPKKSGVRIQRSKMSKIASKKKGFSISYTIITVVKICLVMHVPQRYITSVYEILPYSRHFDENDTDHRTFWQLLILVEEGWGINRKMFPVKQSIVSILLSSHRPRAKLISKHKRYVAILRGCLLHGIMTLNMSFCFSKVKMERNTSDRKH